MKSLWLSVIVAAMLFTSCDKDQQQEPAPAIQGYYTGIFFRTGMDTTQVMLWLQENGDFTGQSSLAKYPAICKGSYQYQQGRLSFSDSCSWTADFDWSLILNGTYQASIGNNGQLRFWRTNGNYTDTYELAQVQR